MKAGLVFLIFSLMPQKLATTITSPYFSRMPHKLVITVTSPYFSLMPQKLTVGSV